MSRTYKDIRKYKKAKFWDMYWENKKSSSIHWYYTGLSQIDNDILPFILKNKEFSNVEQVYTNYSTAPSWWTHLFSNIPKRRQETSLIRKVLTNPEEADALLFPLARKPFVYYW